MSREATSEQLSICEGAGYGEVFQSGHEPDEGFSWSLEREMSTHSPDEEVESYDGEEGEEEEVDEGGEDEGDEGGEEGEDDGDEGEVVERTPEGGSLGSPGNGHTRPFILPKMWTVNDFKPMMTTNIFKNLRDHFQIPDHILIHLLGKFEKCYSGKTVNIGMYDAMFAVGLRLPLTVLHYQLANFLGLSISQIALNAWRICPTPIGTGRATISLFRGRIRYAVQRSGLQCPMALTILRVLSKIQV